MVKVLFVCLGNICRSPAAEAIMDNITKDNNKDNIIKCDSAGTAAYHIGEQADTRMRKTAIERNILINSKGRQFKKNDFKKFDYIIAMDDQNYYDILAQDTSGKYKNKVHRFIDYCPYTRTGHNSPFHKPINEVPDPYYTGEDGFKLVLDILEEGCNNLFDRIIKEDYKHLL